MFFGIFIIAAQHLDMQPFKEKVLQHYIESVSGKINMLQKQQEDLLESLRQETKSTAGDKYETSRAMLHLEQENIAIQLSVLFQQKAILESIQQNEDSQTDTIQFGSLVKTNKCFIFIAVALGRISVDDQTVFAISPESPLGKLIIGKTVDDKVTMQLVSYTIESIL